MRPRVMRFGILNDQCPGFGAPLIKPQTRPPAAEYNGDPAIAHTAIPPYDAPERGPKWLIRSVV